jgi:ankyrin repeat protein
MFLPQTDRQVFVNSRPANFARGLTDFHTIQPFLALDFESSPSSQKPTSTNPSFHKALCPSFTTLLAQPMTPLSTACRMPKNKKKGKQENDNDFNDMLAEFQAADLATASSASSILATSSSSSSAVTSLLSQASENARRRNISEDAIILACMSGDLAQLRRWGQQGVRVTTMEPLRVAVQAKLPFAVLSCLVKDLRADVNQRDEAGWTFLTLAAYLGQHDIVRYFAEELGAHINISDKIGQTPLYLAASMGHLDVVRFLAKLGADINRSTNEGATPLMMASHSKHQEVVKWLVKEGADTQADQGTVTAAHLSEAAGASTEQTAYLEAKTHCSNVGCSGAGIMKCTGCKQARYCGEACQLTHWKAHKADCRRWSAELAI